MENHEWSTQGGVKNDRAVRGRSARPSRGRAARASRRPSSGAARITRGAITAILPRFPPIRLAPFSCIIIEGHHRDSTWLRGMTLRPRSPRPGWPAQADVLLRGGRRAEPAAAFALVSRQVHPQHGARAQPGADWPGPLCHSSSPSACSHGSSLQGQKMAALHDRTALAPMLVYTENS